MERHKFLRLFVALIFIFQCLDGSPSFAKSKELPNSKEDTLFPERLGKILQPSPLKNVPVILYIQDAHCVASAQENIAQIIRWYYNTRSPNTDEPLWIAVEGAFGPVSTAFLQSFPYAKGRRAVTHALLKEGLLTGPEAQAIRHPNMRIHIWGMEDPELYVKNFISFRKVLHLWNDNKVPRSHFEDLLKKIRKNVYTESHQIWTRKLLDFKDRKVGLFETLSFLMAEKLPKTTLRKLIKLHLQHMLAIQKKSRTFDWEKSARKIEKIMEQHLSLTLQRPSEIALWKFEQSYHLTQEALQLQLSREELRLLEQVHSDPQDIEAFLPASKISPDEMREFNQGLKLLQDSLNSVRDFYQGAMARDQALIQNFERLIHEKKPKGMILVTGGFHQKPFLEKLKALGENYSVVYPRISGSAVHDTYWARMMDDRLFKKGTYAIAFVSILNSLFKLLSEAGTQTFRDALMDQFILWMQKHKINLKEALQKWPMPNLPDATTQDFMDSLTRAAAMPPEDLPRRGLDKETLRALKKMGNPIVPWLRTYLTQTSETELLGILTESIPTSPVPFLVQIEQALAQTPLHAEDLNRMAILLDSAIAPFLDSSGNLDEDQRETLGKAFSLLQQIQEKVDRLKVWGDRDRNALERTQTFLDLLKEGLEIRFRMDEYPWPSKTHPREKEYEARGIVAVEDSRVRTPQFTGFVRRLRTKQGLVEIEIHVNQGPLFLINSSGVQLLEEGKPPIDLKPSRERLQLSLRLATFSRTPLGIPTEPLTHFPKKDERPSREEDYLEAIFSVPSIVDDMMEWQKTWLYYRFYGPMEAGAGLGESHVEIKDVPDPYLASQLREKIMNAFNAILQTPPQGKLKQLHQTMLELLIHKFLGNRSKRPRIIFTIDPKDPAVSSRTGSVFFDPRTNIILIKLQSLDRARTIPETFFIGAILYAFTRLEAHWDLPNGPPRLSDTLPDINELKHFIAKNRKVAEGPPLMTKIRTKLQTMARDKRKAQRTNLYPDIIKQLRQVQGKLKKLETLFGRLNPRNQARFKKRFEELYQETHDIEIDLNTALELDDDTLSRSAMNELGMAFLTLNRKMNKTYEELNQTLSAQFREQTQIRPPPSDNRPDFYQILGISKDATGDDIRRAYRALSRKWHPDLNPDNRAEAESRMKQINVAHDVLSDPDKRKAYDRTGFARHLIPKAHLEEMIDRLPADLQPLFEKALANISARIELQDSQIHVHPVLVEFLSILDFLAHEESDFNSIRQHYRFNREDLLHEVVHIVLAQARQENGTPWAEIGWWHQQALNEAADRLFFLYDVTLVGYEVVEELAAKRATYWKDAQRHPELEGLFSKMDRRLLGDIDRLLESVGFSKDQEISPQTLSRYRIEFGITIKASREYNRILWEVFFEDPQRLISLYRALEERNQTRPFRRLLRQVMPIAEHVLDYLIEMDVPPGFLLLVLEHILVVMGEDSETAQRFILQLMDRHSEIMPFLIAPHGSQLTRARLGISPRLFDLIQQAA